MAKRGKGNQIAIWVILGLLIVGLMGFGATNFGGNVTSIGRVGDREITTQRYYNGLVSALRNLSRQAGTNISFAQAQLFGIDQGVLQELTAFVALENEADQLGLSVGDAAVREQVLSVPAFQGLDGSFDREAYRETLRRNGMNEREFEADIRSEVARNLLQGAIVSGVSVPQIYTDTLFNFIGERRSFSWATLRAEDLAEPIGTPTDADLRAYFTENEADFMLPETRKITYAWLSPEMLIDAVEVPEEDVQALYDERISEFVQPERRLVERLVLNDEAAGAKARLDAGELTFDELVAERGLELVDIDLGDVSQEDLGAAGAEVFASDLGVVGPLPSDFGDALYRVNAVLSATETTLEEASPALRAELALERATELVGNQIENIDDLLASGATLEDLDKETDLVLGQIDWTGAPDGAQGDISSYAAFVGAATSAEVGAFPEVLELENGGIFALRLNEIVAPKLPEFDDIRDQAEGGWRAQTILAALSEQGAVLAQQMRDGTVPDTVAVTQESAITRDKVYPDAPGDFVTRVFELDLGATDVIAGGVAVHVVRLGDVLGPDPNDDSLPAQRAAFTQTTARTIGNDILNAYATAVQNAAGITLDQAAINAVHVNIQ